MRQRVLALLNSQQSGLVLVILLLGTVLTFMAGSHEDRVSGAIVNNFLNANTLVQVATDASFFAVMAVGATIVIISGGIDLSVGSIYALSGVGMALLMRSWESHSLLLGLALCLGIGVVCGLLNGALICGLGVHPFIITLGTMWVFRGIAFVTSKAESILVPTELTSATKSTLGLSQTLYPVPMLVMLLLTVGGWLFLQKTVAGRNVYAIGGNLLASRYSGLSIGKNLLGVYVISGLCAGIAAFLGSTYFGSASSADGTGYELYVIASAVVGGASLTGGRGTALGAMLGALLIVLMRQSIRTLKFDQNYEWIIVGVAVIVAVVLDRLNARLTERRLARQSKTT